MTTGASENSESHGFNDHMRAKGTAMRNSANCERKTPGGTRTAAIERPAASVIKVESVRL